LFFAIISSLTTIVVLAGTTKGSVCAQGKTNMDATASDGAHSSRKYKFVEKVDYAAMHDFVVYLKGSFGTNNAASTNLEHVTTTGGDA